MPVINERGPMKVLKTFLKVYLLTFLPRYFSGSEKRKLRIPVKLSKHKNLVNTIINLKCNYTVIIKVNCFVKLLNLSGVQDDKYVSESDV